MLQTQVKQNSGVIFSNSLLQYFWSFVIHRTLCTNLAFPFGLPLFPSLCKLWLLCLSEAY